MVMEGIQEDIGEGNIQCINHPYKNSSPGGICAFCLQEKLGKLVSSSFSSTIFPSSTSSVSTPSFRSEFNGTSTTTSALQIPTNNKTTTDGNTNYHPYDNNNMRKSRIQFLLSQKKKNSSNIMASSGSDSGIVFKRSKSTTTPRNHLHFLEAEDYGIHRKGFWSFLHYSSSKHYSSESSQNGSIKSREKKKEEIVEVEENESPNESTFDRKVARSRSVGCGSRSFSGDLFEKISTGFGECTLRRIESQREGKPRFSSVNHKERVNCGGILSYLVSSEENLHGKSHNISNGRSKNWGWALASPMRAFSKTSSSGKREDSNNKNATPNLAAIPSLLTVSS
ncbi:PREDICTED: uncharacterized protein LOC109241280 [Nicotiana attenuata]|uniref:Uncharacterized protein n=1 Tax=Nicotiana attenuata TaxID=49451 RepID=A0A314L671_NICAT|nr:PREDICTED: uncharacterized protein LOC109241280 [Nicotiana attenuata]OIT37052.1 hypothetical protein A4A49_00986 [Nicotiana attenuata]